LCSFAIAISVVGVLAKLVVRIVAVERAKVEAIIALEVIIRSYADN